MRTHAPTSLLSQRVFGTSRKKRLDPELEGKGAGFFQSYLMRHFLNLKFTFIYLNVPGLSSARRIFYLCCSMRDLQLWHVASSTLSRDGTEAPCIGSSES